jgi:diguanylate cyclase (GGDEF)-like protein/PAS domain S-box-containing protein
MPKKDKLVARRKIHGPKRQTPSSLHAAFAKAGGMKPPQEAFPFTAIRTLSVETESLRATEEQYHLLQGILQSTSDGILAVNRVNEVLFANERFAEMWMIPPELTASRDEALLLQYMLGQLSDPRGFLQRVQELYDSVEDSFDMLYFKDGRVIERRSRFMLHETVVRGRVWSFHEVTERKRIEEALAESETELRALFASMQDVVMVIDRDGFYRKIAPTNPRLLVRPPEELLGKNLKEVFAAEKAEASRQLIQQVLDTNQSTEIEYELMINVRTMWFQATISPLGSDSTLWVAHDISNRKEMEEALRSAEEKSRSIFESATVGIYQSTPDGRLLSVNPFLAHMFGYVSPEEMLASINDVGSQIYRDPTRRQEFQRVLAEQGIIKEFVNEERRKDGTWIWTSTTGRAVKDSAGTILYYEGFQTDITERKNAEEKLRGAKDDLEAVLLKLQQSLERETLLASTDGLTGLCNHRHFFELAAREFQAAVRYQHPLAFVMFDLDYFKQINDMLGHTAGDKLLVDVAQTAVAQVRASDLVARYGGDEFIVLLPHASAQQALVVAERIRAGVAAISVDGLRDHKGPFTVTLSMGITEMQREPADTNLEGIIQRADDALYKAKRSGRNRVEIWAGAEPMDR